VSQSVQPLKPPQESEPAPTGRRSFQASLSRSKLTAILPSLLVVVFIITFRLISPQFLSITNFTTLCAQAGPLLLISSGATFVMLTGGIDLSVAGVATLCSAVAAIFDARYHFGTLGSVMLGVLAGGVTGFANGLIVTRFRLPSFIVTLGTMSIATGVMLHLLGGQSLVLTDLSFGNIAIGQLIPNVPNVAIVALITWLLLVFVRFRTRFGVYTVAIGAGEHVSRLSGVHVSGYKVCAFILSGVTAGLAGVMLLAGLGSATPDAGSQYLLLSIAAIVVGGTSLTGGVGGIHRTIIGVALLTILTNGLDVAGISSFDQEIVQGIVVIVAVLFTIDRSQLQDMIK